MPQSKTTRAQNGFVWSSAAHGPWLFIGLPAVSLILMLLLISPARTEWVDSVIVDLSVLSHTEKVPGPAISLNPGRLQLPPRDTVRSRLHIQPKQPSSMKKQSVVPVPSLSELTVGKTFNKKLKPPKKTGVASAPPQPITKPGPKTEVSSATPTPPPMPRKLPPMAEKAPPAPPPVSKASAGANMPAIEGKDTASISKNFTLKPGRALRIAFNDTETSLPSTTYSDLNTLANTAKSAKDYRLVLMAYAGSNGLSTSKARRISLSRALAVRSFLIDKGVRSTQIDVRALGSKTTEKPANRVDVNLAKR